MKGKFDAYVLWPLAKKFQNWIVDRSTARDFTSGQKYPKTIRRHMQGRQGLDLGWILRDRKRPLRTSEVTANTYGGLACQKSNPGGPDIWMVPNLIDEITLVVKVSIKYKTEVNEPEYFVVLLVAEIQCILRNETLSYRVMKLCKGGKPSFFSEAHNSRPSCGSLQVCGAS